MREKTKYPILHFCPLFSGITDEETDRLIACLSTSKRHYEKGNEILREGEKTNKIGIIISGSAEIGRTDYLGKLSILAIVESGELFAEAFALTHKKTTITLKAKEDMEVLYIPIEKLLHPCVAMCDFHQHLITNLLRISAEKNLAFTEKLAIVTKTSTREKLLSFLQLESLKAQSESFSIPFDRQGLADYLSVERSGLSTQINLLIKEGVIKANKNHFTLSKKTAEP